LIAEVLDEAERGLIDLSSLWVAVRGPASAESAQVLDPTSIPRPSEVSGRIVGTMLTQPLTPRAAAVWAPEVRPSWRRGATAAALVRAALDDLRARGFRLAQAVFDESASIHGSLDLSRGGFPRVTELIYMERPIETTGPSSPSSQPPSTPSWNWVPFCDATESAFRAVMQATYRESLDMPELGGSRSLDDIIADHRAGGRYEPSRWRLGRIAGDPDAAAVLMLAAIDSPEADTWEVVYLGLTPAARGRGLGRAVIDHALELAGPGVARLELAVDVRNLPALRLYESTGFTVIDRRVVHLAVFDA
jgi:ribosomal protein S18 acetylase RimI-like enzyme